MIIMEFIWFAFLSFFFVQQNIEDVNDNAPRFPTHEIELEFPENSKPRDVKRTLPPAIDLDRGK